MIKINNTQYEDYKTKVIWKKISIFSKEQKRTGKAPFITFNINGEIVIEIEFTFSKIMFLNTKINEKIDIKDYVSDIIIKDDKGCCSIISGKYFCSITRINDKTFNLDFSVEDYEISVFINEVVNLL